MQPEVKWRKRGKQDDKNIMKRQTLRSSRSQMFFKIGVLKKLSIFARKHMYLSLFLIKLQAYFY